MERIKNVLNQLIHSWASSDGKSSTIFSETKVGDVISLKTKFGFFLFDNSVMMNKCEHVVDLCYSWLDAVTVIKSTLDQIYIWSKE